MKTVNTIPLNTWNHLKVNERELPNFESTVKKFDLKINSEKNLVKQDFIFQKLADTELESYIKSNNNATLSLVIDKDNIINIEALIQDDNLASSISLLVKENVNLTLYYIVKTNTEKKAFFSMIMKIKALNYSNVNIILVEQKKNLTSSWTNLVIEQEGNSNVDITRILLGGPMTLSSIKSDLKDYKANINVNTYYQNVNNQELDINDVITHIGTHTNSSMFSDGILDGKAHKVYRGTIDFKTGSSSSTGKVIDNVLLMNKEVVNKTCPIILCTEESVVGEHAASIGQFNEEHLFYLHSRGLTMDDAKSLLIEARINFVLKNIKDEKLRDEILAFAKDRL